MDRLDDERRSANMRKIRSKDTMPELAVRRLVHAMGYRYRLHVASLPGKPDLIFRSRRKLIFVHGCFWHQHLGCVDGHVPKSRQEYWSPKLARNVERDRAHCIALEKQGWKICTIWECELSDLDNLRARLKDFLRR
jgi:DNA mismatch endonuclease (patch repair protein)